MLSLIETRDRHFREAYRNVLRALPAGTPFSFDHIVEQAIHSPAPHYYCTYEYALRMIRVLRHGRIRLRRDRRLRQWSELSERCQELEDRRGMTLPSALAHVLAKGNASEFFISPVTGKRILQSRNQPLAQP